MTVKEVYDKTLERANYLRSLGKKYRETKDPLDVMEAASVENSANELYEVVKDLERTEPINPSCLYDHDHEKHPEKCDTHD